MSVAAHQRCSCSASNCSCSDNLTSLYDELSQIEDSESPVFAGPELVSCDCGCSPKTCPWHRLVDIHNTGTAVMVGFDSNSHFEDSMTTSETTFARSDAFLKVYSSAPTLQDSSAFLSYKFDLTTILANLAQAKAAVSGDSLSRVSSIEKIDYMKFEVLSGVRCGGCESKLKRVVGEVLGESLLHVEIERGEMTAQNTFQRADGAERIVVRVFCRPHSPARGRSSRQQTIISALAEVGIDVGVYLYVGLLSEDLDLDAFLQFSMEKREKLGLLVNQLNGAGLPVFVVGTREREMGSDVGESETVVRMLWEVAEHEELLREWNTHLDASVSVSGRIRLLDSFPSGVDKEVISFEEQSSDEEAEDEGEGEIEEVMVVRVLDEDLIDDDVAAVVNASSTFKTSLFQVGGMTCSGCVAKVRAAVSDLVGIDSVKVNLISQKATVVYDHLRVNETVIHETIEKLGYSAEVLQEEARTGEVVFQLQSASDLDLAVTYCMEAQNVDVVDVVSKNHILRVLLLSDDVNPRLLATELRKLNPEQDMVVELATDPRQSLEDSLLRKKEIRVYGVLFLLSFMLTLPAMIIAFLGLVPALKENAAGDPAYLDFRIYRSVTPKFIALFVLCTPVVIGFGIDFYAKGVKSIFSCPPKPDKNALITVSVLVAYVVSIISFVVGLVDDTYRGAIYMEGGATLVCFLLLGRWLENLANSRTSSALVRLLNLQPENAILVESYDKGNLAETEVERAWLWAGDIIKCEAGSKIPTDGVVVQGEGNVDQSLLTGESVPVAKRVNDDVIGGTLVTEGMLFVRVVNVARDTVLSKIIRMIEEAQGELGKVQDVVDKISSVFVPVVIVISVVVFVMWILLAYLAVNRADLKGVHPVLFSLLQASSCLIIACPCALGLAVPLVVMVANGIGASYGVLFKGGACLESLASATVFCFDKTGTLTEGKLVVEEVIFVAEPMEQAQMLELIGVSENCIKSGHPLAKSLVAYAADELGVEEFGSPDEFQSISGQGIRTEIGKNSVLIGNAALMETEKVSGLDFIENEASLSGKTLVLVAFDGLLSVVFSLSDQPRDGVNEVLATLREMKKEVYMLTGDNRSVADEIGKQVGLVAEEIAAGLTPFGKSEFVKKKQEDGETICFLGDGINDSIVLTTADVGVSVGSGTEVAVDCSDIVLMNSDPKSLLLAVDIAKKASCRIRFNLFWAFLYNVVAIPIAAGVLFPAIKAIVPPYIAAILMTLSSLSVTISSILFRVFYRQKFVQK